MQVSWSILVWAAIAASGIVAGIVGVKAWLRLPTKETPVVQYGYKVSTRDPGP
jgi:hypothetical protein